MQLLRQLGKALSRLFEWIGQGWQRLICSVFNLRRGWIRRRRPDYIVFTLDGELAERTPPQPWIYRQIPMFQPPASLDNLSEALGHIAEDPDLHGVVFLLKGLGPALTLSQAQSLTRLFERFRAWDRAENGDRPGYQAKEVVVFLEQTSNALCALGAAADRLILPPQADWNATGLHSEPTYLADALALLGVDFDVVKIAPWKTAFDRFSRTEMSDEAADQLNWLLDSLYHDLVIAIAQGRNLPEDEVTRLIDSAPHNAEAALAANLVDALAYEDELPWLLRVEESAGKTHGSSEREARFTTFRQAKAHLLRRPRRKTAGRIGVLSLTGTIMPGKSRRFPVELPLLGDRTIGSSTVQQEVRAALKDDSLDAVVLYVDSGGGSALASDLMWREITLLASQKPLVVYMGNVAASGGYYIATPAQRIVAQSATMTGSIGVIIGKPVTGGAYDKARVNRYSITRGDNADIFSDQAPWAGQQREQIEAQVRHSYAAFKRRVADGRNLPFDDLDSICSGKVWTGAQALENGLIDEIGDFRAAVNAAAQLADLPKDGHLDVVDIQANRPLLPVTQRQLQDAQELARLVLRRDWKALFSGERIWFMTDGLPKI
ncbi:signal peptide peptidase SppA [bacterium]|nr:signal peptide peptidase SppA [bacterium]